MNNYQWTLAEILKTGPVVVDTCALIGSLNKEYSEGDPLEIFFPFLFPENKGVYTCSKVVGEYLSIQDEDEKRRRVEFINRFTSVGGILTFSGKKNHLYCRYYQQIRESGKERGIHQTDLDLLASASVLSEGNEIVSILSKDFPLIQTWSDACNKGIINSENVRFYIRQFRNAFRGAFVKR